MQLDGYEFLDLSQADGILVTNAREKESGKPVQIHLFPSERAQEANQLCQKILSLPDSARRMVIKFGKDGSSTYFVTDQLPPGQGLKTWMSSQSGEPAAPPAAAPPAPAPPSTPKSDGPGEFTRLYTREDLQSMRSTAAPTPSKAPAAPEPKGPGEFTRMYTAEEVRTLRQSAPPPPPPPASPPSSTPAPPPGLETFIFERSSITRPAPVITPKQHAPVPEPPPPPPPPVYRPPVAEPPAPSRGDTFEAPQPIFAPPVAPPPAPAPPPVAQQPPPPAPVHARVEAPRAPAAPFDWKVAVLLAAALLVIVAIVIVVVG